MKPSLDKQRSIDYFRDYVSSGKAAIFEKYGMDYVMGSRDSSWLNDLDGEKRLFDLHCNGGVFNLGHKNPIITETLKEAVDDLDIGNHHLISMERAELGAMIADLMPGDLKYTIFGVSGGEAVDLAIKVARGYTERLDIISVKGGYHGHTGLALAAGDAHYRKLFGPHLPGFIQVPFGDLDELRAQVTRETAAIILETIPATLGVRIPSKSYLQGIRQLCDERDVLLIMDEVQTGLGRTGKLWAFEHFDIVPDMVVLGKGLSGGLYPITATVIRTSLETVFHPDPFIHVSTFGGAEVGCRVAKKVLEISSSSDFLSHVNTLADTFKKGFEKLMKKHPRFFVELRQLGLVMGLKLKDEISGPLLMKTAYDHDLLLIYANNDRSVSQCLPPLVMVREDIDWVMSQLDGALSSAKRLRPIAKGKKAIESLWGELTGN